MDKEVIVSPMLKPAQYRAKLEEIIPLNDKYYQFSFELTQPHRLDFLAGQYVSIKVDESGERRSYSICSSPAINHGFELLLDAEPNGLGTKFLKSLQFGQEIEFLAPLGRFVLAENQEPIVLVAAGSGIAPFRAMVLDLLQNKQSQQDIALYWGMRYDEQLFWLEEFSQLMEAFKNFKLIPVISKPSEAWTLDQGRVTDALRVHGLAEKAHYYLCGGEQMVIDTRSLLEEMGISEEQIHYEKFY